MWSAYAQSRWHRSASVCYGRAVLRRCAAPRSSCSPPRALDEGAATPRDALRSIADRSRSHLEVSSPAHLNGDARTIGRDLVALVSACVMLPRQCVSTQCHFDTRSSAHRHRPVTVHPAAGRRMAGSPGHAPCPLTRPHPRHTDWLFRVGPLVGERERTVHGHRSVGAQSGTVTVVSLRRIGCVVRDRDHGRGHVDRPLCRGLSRRTR